MANRETTLHISEARRCRGGSSDPKAWARDRIIEGISPTIPRLDRDAQGRRTVETALSLMPRAFLFQGTGLEAERKMGQMLAETERAKGGNPKLTCNHREQVAPTLPELGISRKESAEAQMLAELPAEDFCPSEAVGFTPQAVGQFLQEIVKTEELPKLRKSAISHESDFERYRADHPDDHHHDRGRRPGR